MNQMIRLRTMETAYQAIKEMDPDTAITRWAIRQAVSGGYVPSRRVGNKYVFNLDALSMPSEKDILRWFHML